MAPDVDLFVTELSAARAVVYARIGERQPGAGWSITGEIRGPRSRVTAMLSAKFALRDLGAGPTVLAKALVTDPVGWSPDIPALYDVQLELRQHGAIVETLRRPLALRWLEVRGASLYRQSSRIIVRGIFAPAISHLTLEEIRRSELTIFQPSPRDLPTMTEWGISAATVLPAGDDIAATISAAAREPAVGMVVLPRETRWSPEISLAGPNLLLACRCREPDDVPAWAQIILADVDRPDAFGRRWAGFTRPVIAIAGITGGGKISDPREACDSLRRELAPFGQFAGYVLE